MNIKERNSLSLKNTTRFLLFFPVLLIIVLFVLSIIFVVSYISTSAIGWLIALIVIFTVFVIGLIIVGIYSIRRINDLYYNQIYKVTYDNIKKLSNNDTALEDYNILSVDEIRELNELTIAVKNNLNNSYLICKTANYDKLNLKYIDKEKRIITYDSFKKNLGNIIFLSQSFRNVIIDVSFNIKGHTLTEGDKYHIFDIYYHTFNDYGNSLFMFGDDDQSLLIYLPVIDNFSRIKEQLEDAIQDSGVVIRDIRGLENVAPQYTIVAYPYSSEENLLSDLRYAKRQNLPFNLFLPNRTKNNIGQQVIMSTSMNINYMSKMLTTISTLEYNSTDNENNKVMIKSLFTDLTNYLDIDDAGIIIYDNATLKYIPYLETEATTLFKKSGYVDPGFVRALDKACDDDNSYYFSSRNHANNSLGRHLDYYGISSGYYHIVRNNKNDVIAVIYFFNRNKEFLLDAYLRESFFMIGNRIAHYFEMKDLLDYINLHEERSECILSISNNYLYEIDDDFNLTYASNDLKRLFKKYKIGEKCYKTFYGLERACADCPLKTYKKKIGKFNNEKYEIALTLNERKTHNRSLLISKYQNEVEEMEESTDLFNRDFLSYSYYSLFNTLKNEYYTNGRGYVLLLRIDNYEDFLSSQGSEGYLFAVRHLIRSIKNKLKTNDIYLYNPTTLAIHFPFVGHADVINKCEIIYELSKDHYFDDGSVDQFKLTYLPLGYPRGYASVDDFLKHVSDFYHSDKYEINKDYIYFSDYSISRSASKREFMISVIESEFSSQNSTSMNLQPIVQVKNNHIYGAEILLRINDAHRNVFFNAEEISHIAEQENKTHLITESIINFVGNMYKEHGRTTFKNNGFNRIAINIDQTYLKDPQLIKSVVKLCEVNNLPNNFLSFEIMEDIIPDNIDKIKKFANELKNYHIYFSCDRYTGQHVGVEQLKELGFNEVKIARDLIMKIDKDPNRLKEVGDIVKYSHSFGLSTAAVGVENETQLRALKDLDNEMVVQGYFLYKPLTRSDLLSAIISYSK